MMSWFFSFCGRLQGHFIVFLWMQNEKRSDCTDGFKAGLMKKVMIRYEQSHVSSFWLSYVHHSQYKIAIYHFPVSGLKGGSNKTEENGSSSLIRLSSGSCLLIDTSCLFSPGSKEHHWKGPAHAEVHIIPSDRTPRDPLLAPHPYTLAVVFVRKLNQARGTAAGDWTAVATAFHPRMICWKYLKRSSTFITCYLFCWHIEELSVTSLYEVQWREMILRFLFLIWRKAHITEFVFPHIKLLTLFLAPLFNWRLLRESCESWILL